MAKVSDSPGKPLDSKPALRLTRRGALRGGTGALAGVIAAVDITKAAAQGHAPTYSQAHSQSGPHVGHPVPPAGEQTAADQQVSERMIRFSRFIAEAKDRPLPEAMQERTKWAIVDAFAAMVSGSQLPGGTAPIRFARAYGGKPVATVIGDDTVCGPIEAALANGTMGHADETDDFSRQWHPGINIVPVALAVGEQFQASGLRFLRSVAVGYDIGTRVKDSTGMPSGTPLMAPRGVAGTFGGAATAACIMGFNEQQVRWTMAYAAQQRAGIDDFRRDLQHVEKGFLNGGLSARNAVTAALLVHAGLDAVNDIFSGPSGFFEAFPNTAKPDALTDRLGEVNEVMITNMKRWPVGSPIQFPLDALYAIFKKRSIDPAQIREILVGGVPDSIVDNAGSTAINTQHAVALMLVDKTVNFTNIHDQARLRDPALIRLRGMTKIIPLTPGTPVIQITLADGTRIIQEEVKDVPGSAGRPYTAAWVSAKARELMSPVLGENRTDKLIDRLLHIEDVKNVLELRPFLQVKYAANAKPRLSRWPENSMAK